MAQIPHFYLSLGRESRIERADPGSRRLGRRKEVDRKTAFKLILLPNVKDSEHHGPVV